MDELPFPPALFPDRVEEEIVLPEELQSPLNTWLTEIYCKTAAQINMCLDALREPYSQKSRLVVSEVKSLEGTVSSIKNQIKLMKAVLLKYGTEGIFQLPQAHRDALAFLDLNWPLEVPAAPAAANPDPPAAANPDPPAAAVPDPGAVIAARHAAAIAIGQRAAAAPRVVVAPRAVPAPRAAGAAQRAGPAPPAAVSAPGAVPPPAAVSAPGAVPSPPAAVSAPRAVRAPPAAAAAPRAVPAPPASAAARRTTATPAPPPAAIAAAVRRRHATRLGCPGLCVTLAAVAAILLIWDLWVAFV